MSHASRKQVIDDVWDERSRQDEKWGEQDHPDDTGPITRPLCGHGSADLDLRTATELVAHFRDTCDNRARRGSLGWSDILLKEVIEAVAESDPAQLRKELIQVAAVAVSWVEAIDRRATASSVSR